MLDHLCHLGSFLHPLGRAQAQRPDSIIYGVFSPALNRQIDKRPIGVDQNAVTHCDHEDMEEISISQSPNCLRSN